MHRRSAPSYAVLIGRGLVFAFLLVLVFVLAAATLPRALGYQPLTVTGGSMGDAAPVGSLVVVRPERADRIEVGDVVLLRAPGAQLPKIHRVIALEQSEDGIVARTQGDANDFADPEPRVLGESVWTPVTVVPHLGHPVAFVAKPLGWLLLIAVPAAVLCFCAIRRIWAVGQPGSPSRS